MNPFVGRAMRLIAPVALAVLAVLWTPGRAWAPNCPGCLGLAGMWHGLFLSDQTGQVAPVELDITSERNRRFGGTWSEPGADLMIPFEGTLAASDVVTLVGRGSDGMFVANQGDWMPNGDGTAFLESDLRLMLADGTSNTGMVCFLQDFKAKNPPQLANIALDWQGQVMVGGVVVGTVDVGLDPNGSTPCTNAVCPPPSFFMGHVTFPFLDPSTLAPFNGPLDGTISDAGATGMSLVHALAKSALVMVMVNGTAINVPVGLPTIPSGPPSINAMFTATFADGSVLQGSFMLFPHNPG